jgi:hypothetical protein
LVPLVDHGFYFSFPLPADQSASSNILSPHEPPVHCKQRFPSRRDVFPQSERWKGQDITAEDRGCLRSVSFLQVSEVSSRDAVSLREMSSFPFPPLFSFRYDPSPRLHQAEVLGSDSLHAMHVSKQRRLVRLQPRSELETASAGCQR